MTSLNDDLTIHRAVYGDAHRRGDALATARAAARLRAHITDLDAAELTVVRASRQRFGQAIREARSRRRAAPVVPMQALAIPLSPPRRSPVALAALFALLALVLAAVVGGPLLVEQTEGGAGGGAPVDVVDPVVQPVTLSRGRVILAVAAVVPAVVEEPQVTASPDPIAVVATPGPAAPANGADAPAGSGPPGNGGGPGSGGPGNGSGSGAPSPAPTATRTPAPTLAICFASVPRGFARLCGQILDARTGRGLADACVSLGPCNSQSARTDANGRWAFPLVVGNGSLTWFLEFSKPGYTTSLFSQTSRQGRILIPTLVLTPN